MSPSTPRCTTRSRIACPTGGPWYPASARRRPWAAPRGSGWSWPYATAPSQGSSRSRNWSTPSPCCRGRSSTSSTGSLPAPLPPPATLVLLDEHEAAHKPPGAPRMHSRDVALERRAREPLALLLTAATPSLEAWWRAESGLIDMPSREPGPWPAVSVADTRGILRREPLTPPLARAIRETLAAKRRVFLVVSRLTSSLACDECGAVVRCGDCAIGLAYSRAAARLVFRVCGASPPLPDTCAACHGRRLTPFGWGAERVEHAVRRRFSDARIARWDPDAARGARGEAQP